MTLTIQCAHCKASITSDDIAEAVAWDKAHQQRHDLPASPPTESEGGAA